MIPGCSSFLFKLLLLFEGIYFFEEISSMDFNERGIADVFDGGQQLQEALHAEQADAARRLGPPPGHRYQLRRAAESL